MNDSIPRRLPSIAERLRDMNPADLACAGKIGDCAGDPKDSVESARRKTHRRGGVGEQLTARLVGRGHFVQQLAVRFGVGPDATAVVALRLDGARRGHPPRHLLAAFGRWRQGQVGARLGLEPQLRQRQLSQGRHDQRLVLGR